MVPGSIYNYCYDVGVVFLEQVIRDVSFVVFIRYIGLYCIIVLFFTKSSRISTHVPHIFHINFIYLHIIPHIFPLFFSYNSLYFCIFQQMLLYMSVYFLCIFLYISPYFRILLYINLYMYLHISVFFHIFTHYFVYIHKISHIFIIFFA